MDRRLRVLMAGPDPHANGGIATVARNYLQSDLVQRCDLRYITTMVEGSKPRKLGVAARAFAAYARELPRADLVHLHLSKGASFTRKRMLACLAYRQGVPYVIHLHSGEFVNRYQAASHRVQRQVAELFEKASAVIALSEEWRSALTSEVCSSAPIVVVRNAVSLPPEPTYPVNHTVLYLGRLDRNKSPDVLLRAVARLCPYMPDIKVVFAGDGEVDYYQRLAYTLGISDHCSFLGWVSDEKERLLSEASVFCLPSRTEGMPMSLLEAMSYGIVAIATPVGGVPSVVHDGKNGLLVPVGDDVALSSALANVLGHQEFRQTLGERARATIAEKFSLQAHVEELVDLYSTVALSRGIGTVGQDAQ